MATKKLIKRANVSSPVVQTQFMGATILNFDSRLGWGADSSEVTVQLVEDKSNSTKRVYNNFGGSSVTNAPDVFSPGALGSAQVFRYGSFAYGGLLENWEKNSSMSGHTYSVRLRSPTKILQNAKIITTGLDDAFTESTNLINIHQAAEQVSWCNDVGITWTDVKQVIQGWSFEYRGQSFQLNVAEIPACKIRFDGDVLSVMDAINRAASAQALRIFVDLTVSGAGAIIGVHSHSSSSARASAVSPTAQSIDTIGVSADERLQKSSIYRAVGNGPLGIAGASPASATIGNIITSISTGIESTDVTTQSVVNGEFEHRIFRLEDDGGEEGGDGDGSSTEIRQYWGEDPETGEALVGSPKTSAGGTDMGEAFTVKTSGQSFSHLELGVYEISELEIRAAEESFESWNHFMITFKPDVLKKITGAAAAVTQPWLSAEILDFCRTGGDEDEDSGDSAGSDNFANYQKDYIEQLQKQKDKAPALQQVHQFVTSFGSYYGQQYFVSLPQLECCPSQLDIEVNQSYEQSDGGWPLDDLEADILGLSMTGDAGLELFKTENGKVGPILKYDGATCTDDEDEKIDVGRLSGSWYNKGGQNGQYWLQASFDKIVGHPDAEGVDPKCSTTKSPGGILSCAGVKRVPNVGGDSNEVDGLGMALFKFIIEEEESTSLTTEERVRLREVLAENLIASNWRGLGLAPEPCKPVAAAVPLKSNRLSYGPWYSPIWNTKGEARYRRETSLAPWTFGSYVDMNEAGAALVATDCSNQTEQESGSLKFAGLPSSIFGVSGGLGSSLQGYGANCTSISINFGMGGLTTSLQFRTFVRNFGELASEKLKWMQTISEAENKFQRAFNQKKAEKENKELVKQFRSGAGATEGTPGAKNSYSSGAKSNSFNKFKDSKIGSCLVSVNDVDAPSVHLMSSSELLNLIPTDERYEKWHVASLESIFRPITFHTGTVGHQCDQGFGDVQRALKNHPMCPWIADSYAFSQENGGGGRTSYGVNVLSTGEGGMDDSGLGSPDSSIQDDPVRAFALKGPLMLSGHGFDLHSGQPVPRTEDGDKTVIDPELGYVAGKEIVAPVDLRFDSIMGVWTTPKFDPMSVGFDDPRRPTISGRQIEFKLTEDMKESAAYGGGPATAPPFPHSHYATAKIKVEGPVGNPFFWRHGKACRDVSSSGGWSEIEIRVRAPSNKYLNAKEGDEGWAWWDGESIVGKTLQEMCEFYAPDSQDCSNYDWPDEEECWKDGEWQMCQVEYPTVDEWLRKFKCDNTHALVDEEPGDDSDDSDNDGSCAELVGDDKDAYITLNIVSMGVDGCGIDEEKEDSFPCTLADTYSDDIAPATGTSTFGFDEEKYQFLVHFAKDSDDDSEDTGDDQESSSQNQEHGQVYWRTSSCSYIHEELKEKYACHLTDTYDDAHTLEDGVRGGGTYLFHQDRNQALMHTKGGSPGSSSADDIKESQVRWGTLQTLSQTWGGVPDDPGAVHKHFPPVLEMTYKMGSYASDRLPGINFGGYKTGPYEGGMNSFGFDPMKAQVLAHKAFKDGDADDNEDYSFEDAEDADHPSILWGDPLEIACPIHEDDQSDFPCYIHDLFKGAKNTDGDKVVSGTLSDFGFEEDTPQTIIHIPKNDDNDVASLKWGDICNLKEDTQGRLPCYLGQTYKLTDDETEGGEWDNSGGFGFDKEKNQMLTHTGSEDSDAVILWKDSCNIPEDVAGDFPCTLEDTYGGAFDGADGKDLGYDKDIKQILGHEEGESLEWMEDVSSCLIPEALRGTWPCNLEQTYKGTDGETENSKSFGYNPAQEQIFAHAKKKAGQPGGPQWLKADDLFENCSLDSEEKKSWACSLEYTYKGASGVTAPESTENFGWVDENMKFMVGFHDVGTSWETHYNVSNQPDWPNTLESMYDEKGGDNQVLWGKSATPGPGAANNSVTLTSGKKLDKSKSQVVGHEKGKPMGWLDYPECPILTPHLDDLPCHIYQTLGGPDLGGWVGWKSGALPSDAYDYGYRMTAGVTANQVLAHGPDTFFSSRPGPNDRDLAWCNTLTHQIYPSYTTSSDQGNIPTYISNTIFGANGFDATKYTTYGATFPNTAMVEDHLFDLDKTQVLVSKKATAEGDADTVEFQWVEQKEECEITPSNQLSHPCHLWQTYKGVGQAQVDDLDHSSLYNMGYDDEVKQYLSHNGKGSADDKVEWVNADGDCDITEESDPPATVYPCTIGDLHPESTSEANGKSTFAKDTRQFLGHNPEGSSNQWPATPVKPSVQWMELYGVEKNAEGTYDFPPTLEHTYTQSESKLGGDFNFIETEVQVLGHDAEGKITWMTVKDCS